MVVEAPEGTIGTAVQSYKLDAAMVDGVEWLIFPRADLNANVASTGCSDKNCESCLAFICRISWMPNDGTIFMYGSTQAESTLDSVKK